MKKIMPNLESVVINEETDKMVISLIDKLMSNEVLSKKEYLFILDNISLNTKKYLFSKGYLKKQNYYQNRVYLRGLIEISNYCKKGCLYCGINNKMQVERYRLSIEEIINTCKEGYNLGYRTFVIQGGEDSYYETKMIVEMIKSIKSLFNDIRITLSLGERSFDDYQAFYDAGADRYLLRHEAASKKLYDFLHPSYMSYENRIECLKNLKSIGYQVGAGFMVGSPTQTNEDLVEDLLFLKSLNPHMVGIGPYLCHSDTVFKDSSSGTLDETLVMVALTRLILPKTLLPSTTALGSLSPIGREKALKVGANVLMPNISPTEHRIKYEIYQDKICVTDTSDQCRNCIEGRVVMIDHEIDLGVGDALNYNVKK